MNGVHDMGGMHGFGPVVPEADEPLFHHDWEARALAITLAMAGWKRWNLDVSRHARERSDPADYLRNSYYERWINGLGRLMVEQGLLTEREWATMQPDPAAPRQTPPIRPQDVPALLDRGGPTARSEGQPAGFAVGQRVRARNINPAGHTRLPRYVRGHVGTIMLDHGPHVFADDHAHFRGENPQHLYNVRFEAAELWGADAAFRGDVRVDLWESHLEPA